MSENMKIWNELRVTDPAATKPFKRPGGFQGTAIKPTWVVKRLTEVFGPAGKGWGVEYDEPIIQEAGGSIVAYIGAALWYVLEGEVYRTPRTFGGDFIAKPNRDGVIVVDDEALKKASTDAFTKAASYIGIAADVHSGAFDNQKYVEAARQEWQHRKGAQGAQEVKAKAKAEESPQPEPHPQGEGGDVHGVPASYMRQIEARIREQGTQESLNAAVEWLLQNFEGSALEHLLEVADRRRTQISEAA